MFQTTFIYKNRWWAAFENQKASGVWFWSRWWSWSVQLAAAGPRLVMAVSTSECPLPVFCKRGPLVWTCNCPLCPLPLILGPPTATPNCPAPKSPLDFDTHRVFSPSSKALWNCCGHSVVGMDFSPFSGHRRLLGCGRQRGDEESRKKSAVSVAASQTHLAGKWGLPPIPLSHTDLTRVCKNLLCLKKSKLLTTLPLSINMVTLQTLCPASVARAQSSELSLKCCEQSLPCNPAKIQRIAPALGDRNWSYFSKKNDLVITPPLHPTFHGRKWSVATSGLLF